MLVRWYVLALGAVIAGGCSAIIWFVGEGARGILAGNSIFVLPAQPGARRRWSSVPFCGVESLPLVVAVVGIAIAWYAYIRDPRLPAQDWRARSGPLYLFLYNKWYFDEIYDFLFVRPRLLAGRILWKRGDGMVIDGFGPRRHRGATIARRHRSRDRPAPNAAMSIHYAFVMLIGRRGASSPGSCSAGRPERMSSWPLLSLVTFLPLLGVA